MVSTLWQLSIRQVCGSSQVGMARALAEQQERQDALRLSLSDSPAGARSPQVHAFLYEVLRLYPPIPQLFNRCVAEPAALVLPSLGVPLRPGTYVGWTAFGLHRGPHASLWQPDPAAFRPERWGDSVLDIDRLARKANSEGQFATFHGGARACEYCISLRAERVELSEPRPRSVFRTGHAAFGDCCASVAIPVAPCSRA